MMFGPDTLRTCYFTYDFTMDRGNCFHLYALFDRLTTVLHVEESKQQR